MNRDAPFDRPDALAWGAQLARVVSVDDPESMNRVEVRLVALDAVDGHDAPMWARVVSAFAGADRGVFFMPDVDDEVLVVFVGGDPRQPLVLGGLWNGATPAPAQLGAAGNRTKRIRSRNGITVTLDDVAGQETLTLETPGGQTVTLRDGPSAVTIADANGNTVELAAAGVTVTASARVSVSAASVAVSAGMVDVSAGLSKFSGVVQCDTLIANSVVSAAYTPGAGNIW